MNRFLVFALMLFGTLAATGQVAQAQANSQTTGTASTPTPEPSGVTPHVVATDPSEAPSGAVVQLFVQPKTALDGGNTRVFLDEDEARIVDAEPGWLTVIVPAKNPKGGREITRIFLEVQGKRGEPYEKFSVISPKVVQRPDLPWGIAGIEPSAPPGWPTNVRFTSDIPVEYWGATQVLFNNTPAKILSMKPGVFRVEVPLDLGTTQPVVVFTVSGVKAAPYQNFRVAPEPVATPAPSQSAGSSRVSIWATVAVFGILILIGAYFVYGRRRRRAWARERKEVEARQIQFETEQATARERYAKQIAELKLALDERTRVKSGGALVSDETAKRQENKEGVAHQDKSIVDGFVPAPPDELVEVCASGECILFAGGGIGAQAGYPIWGTGLARLLEMAAEANPSAAWDSLRTALTNGDLSLVAELIRSRLPEGELLAMVKATFKTESTSLPAVHRAFRNIPFLGVMTTNWDNLLAETFSFKDPVRLSPRDTTSFLELTREIRFFLLQLYGDPNQPESFIFTPAEYLKNIFETEAFGKFIAFLFQAKTFFFAGTSLAGIEDFLSGLRLRAAPNRRHFALVPWQSDIDIQSERFESHYGVELLVYGPTPDFPEVPRFVEELRYRVRNKGTRAAKPEIEAAKLESITLENIGPFESLTLSFEQPWNVLLGNNGSGKSTLLKAIALGLCGDDPKAAEAGVDLLRSNSAKGAIVLRIGGTDFTTTLAREGEKVTVRSSVTPLQAGRWAVLGFPPLRGASLQNPRGPSQGATTAHPDVKDLLPLVHSQVDYRMDSVKQWLVNVHTWSQGDKPEEVQDSARYAALRDAFFKILGALTPGVSVAFAGIAKGTFQIMVQTQDGIVPIDLVSQGTSSVFGWIGALLQRMYEIYGDQPGVEAKPALVLVDEIDAHMHPDWQRKIVPLIKSLFPNLQVFATTHSPLIIGSMEKNEIYHLRRREGIVSVERLTFSPKGWRADQILTSSGFELPTTVSPEGVKLRESYGEALAKASDPANKNDDAVKEQYEKMALEIGEAIPTHPETSEERLALEMLEQWMLERFMEQPDEARDKVIQRAQGIYARIKSGGASDESNQV
jgi:energy-coupling factor transporter ATP-binding protein EcfA2